MSVQAMSWALKQQLEINPQARHVLLCLANYAQPDGTSAFPSNATLCTDTGLSESSVRRNLQRLERAGLIERDDQRIVSLKIKRLDKRTVAYKINMGPRGVTLTPRASYGVSGSGLRGVSQTETGCQSLTPNPLLIRQEPALPSVEEELQARKRRSPRPLATLKPTD